MLATVPATGVAVRASAPADAWRECRSARRRALAATPRAPLSAEPRYGIAVFLTQDPRQSEVREDAAVAEPGDRGYPVALQREDEHCVRPRDVGLGSGEVDAEGRLAVGAGRHQ